MKKQLLTRPERAFVEEARGNTGDKTAYMTLSVSVLLDVWLTQEATAVLLGIGLGTVNKCKQKYESDGLDSYLDKHYVPYQGKLSDADLSEVEQRVNEGMYRSSQVFGQWIKDRFGISYSESAIRSILNKLDFVYKKTSSVPGKLDVAEQEAFISVLVDFLAQTNTETVLCFFENIRQYKWELKSLMTPNFQRFSA